MQGTVRPATIRGIVSRGHLFEGIKIWGTGRDGPLASTTATSGQREKNEATEHELAKKIRI
jgi:hypothetical protein